MKSVRAVVFDAVGTLIHPDPPVSVAYKELGFQHGSQLTREDIARNFHRVLLAFSHQTTTDEEIELQRWRQIVAGVFSDLEDTDRLFCELWDHFARPASWSVNEDAAAALADLKLRGYQTAIGSNFDNRLLAIVPKLPPLNQVQEIFVSSQVGFAKPAVQFFRAIEVELNLFPDELLMVGDDPANDIAGAAEAGWHSLLLNREHSASVPDSIRSLREIASRLP
ncbi:MAG: HAD-IA family hydrolase [Planctomycetaceae bacterium]|nr:HAD-IA family hydrolase [Planctomycetales bacterium]MCB9921197.1 HAD-IA family hydrolase [Planctomycetaceae bacterium]